MSDNKFSKLWSLDNRSPDSDGSKSLIPSTPVSWREILAAIAIVALADTTIYRGAGFTGLAALFVGVIVFVGVGGGKPAGSWKAVFFALLGVLAAAKLVWCGFISTAVAGAAAVLVYAALRTGNRLRFQELFAYPCWALFSGGSRLNAYGKFVSTRNRQSTVASLAVFLPLGVLLVFGTIFVLANPDLVQKVRLLLDEFGNFFSRLTEWLPDVIQIPFWLLCFWIVAGMFGAFRLFPYDDDFERVAPNDVSETKSPYYAACRNTLLAVIVLFAAYLVFEFKTLWFRRFPEGFCYSGYSHEGAAWLTVALGVSTVILSSIFRGDMLRDSRIATLRRLAWAWSFLNIVLAVAVFNRLYIYIGFNGMTRMRVVGLLGMTAVLIGFLFVVRKIAKQKSFDWLLRRFAWTVLAMLFLDCVLPVDWLVHRYNVSRIMGGDLAPAVQISVHPCGNEGVLTFLPILDCKDELIREGIKAHLADKLRELRQRPIDQKFHPGPEINTKKPYNWTRFQLADRLLKQQLEEHRELLDEYAADPPKANDAFKRFADYVYRWY